jgi:hypothetical protein
VARETRRRAARIAAPLIGLAGAVLLHALWNAGAEAGLIFFAVYAFVMLPGLVVLAVIAGLALKAEGRVIHAQLASDVARGLITPALYGELCSIRGRLHASMRAFGTGGRSALEARRALHRAASELAFLRQRVARGDEPRNEALEASYCAELAAFTARQAVPRSPVTLLS